MPAQILENVRGADVPKDWQDQIKLDQNSFYTVIFEPVAEYIEEDLPPEEKFKKEFIEAVEMSATEARTGKGTLCGTREETEAFLKSVWEKGDE